ncbi:MAG: efflux RND transporter permease subunit [Verrucomicrobiaceae bacterium]|nr:efflux RND transporter permease subunit [Verrucomicrobiaceae bacterium]
MNFSQFFITRPIFAGVLSIILVLVGGISLNFLPVSEYPEVAPPNIVVRAVYPGANPQVIAETVSTPLEKEINGVSNSIYMYSQATGDGVMSLTVTFKIGTDLDKAQVAVQNRVNQALPRLPEEVRRLGITTMKSSPDLTMVVHLFSPDGRYDDIYVRNYATMNVKDQLARIPGAGNVTVFGSGDYSMRIWLNPEKVASIGMTPADIIRAIQSQNAQVAAGSIGNQPISSDVPVQLQITTKGRLVTEDEFAKIIIKTGPNGETVELKDVARVELGASEYALRSTMNNKNAVAVPIFQQPGSNSLQLSAAVRAEMEKLKANFPDGIEYTIAYDPTVFVQQSIDAVIHTLLEAILLVVIVVIVFLQTWRASIIPLAAVPVSLIGTFAVMHALGFSINALSLFGLVLAIGIVVDDAIVVVENVERNIREGLTPLEATRVAMKEVTGPIVATALVLCAVFVPTAFISGLTGQFYKQFALTIAISTVISAFNSLTLSPALSALLLKGHHDKPDLITRLMNFSLGWFFKPFNWFFEKLGGSYQWIVGRAIRLSVVSLLLYGGLVYLGYDVFNKVPGGFVPTQDKKYLVAFAQLPDGASLERTDAVMRRMSDIIMKTPGVENAIGFPGLSINGFSNASNSGIVFVGLKPFEERTTPDLSGEAISMALNMQFSQIQEAFVLAVMPPAVNGMGAIGGFKLQVEDRADLGVNALANATNEIIGKAYQTGVFAPMSVFTGFRPNTPQLAAEVDWVKAESLGISKQEISLALQVYLGSLYVNDFNRFGRTWQVVVQADQQYRAKAEDITKLKVRNTRGEMVPLATVLKVTPSSGPDRVMHYNSYLSAEINGNPAPGRTSGEAEAMITKIAKETLPKGMDIEWTELKFQQELAGNTAVYVFPLCVMLVFLVLAAQYESLRMPLAIVLVIPLTLLSALVGVMITTNENNIFTQIGLIVLVGLACKNAILIVEFAKVKQDEGMTPFEAAVTAARLRLRPILMTSIAFIAGVWPLVASHGAGAEMRHAMGIAVFSGMIGVTLFGLLLTPVFYYVLMKWGWKKRSTLP